MNTSHHQLEFVVAPKLATSYLGNDDEEETSRNRRTSHHLVSIEAAFTRRSITLLQDKGGRAVRKSKEII
jgi:hypothetical protein